MSAPFPTYDEEIAAEYRESLEYNESPSDYPWGACRECGAPATLDNHDEPMRFCNDCRRDHFYRCDVCGQTYRRDGVGHVGYVVVVAGDGTREYLCHEDARARFAKANGRTAKQLTV